MQQQQQLDEMVFDAVKTRNVAALKAAISMTATDAIVPLATATAYMAITCDDPHIVLAILQLQGAVDLDPSMLDNGALVLAASRNHLDIVKLLLINERVDPTADNGAAVISAVANNNAEMVGVLLSRIKRDLTGWGTHRDIKSNVARTSVARRKSGMSLPLSVWLYVMDMRIPWFCWLIFCFVTRRPLWRWTTWLH